MPVTLEQMNGLDPLSQELKRSGLTVKKYVDYLKKELEATEIKTVKVKGAINEDVLPDDFQVVGTTGIVDFGTEDGEQWHSDGETLIRYDPAALKIRQEARRDLGRHLGVYNDKLEIDMSQHLMTYAVQALKESKKKK